jgi:hypothetical protein
MPWNERSRMDKRVLLVGEYLKGERPMTEVGRDSGSAGRQCPQQSSNVPKLRQPLRLQPCRQSSRLTP